MNSAERSPVVPRHSRVSREGLQPSAAGHGERRRADRRGERARSTEERLWKVADAARFLSVSKSFVYKAAEDGTMPCIRLGAALRFEPAAVRAFAAGHRQEIATIRFDRLK